MSGYTAFQPMWEAWKRNTKRPSDLEEAANWDAAREIFLAVPNPGTEVLQAEAVAFVRQSLIEWRNRLKQCPEWNPKTERVRLYRGMRNESAAEARVRGHAGLPAGKPVSMTFDRRSAVGFAGQGLNDGYVCTAEVPLEAIVFADLDGLYREGNMHDEAEIVVVSQTEIPVVLEIERVPARARMVRSNSQKTANARETARLQDYEVSLQEKAKHSGSEKVELSERETELPERWCPTEE